METDPNETTNSGRTTAGQEMMSVENHVCCLALVIVCSFENTR